MKLKPICLDNAVILDTETTGIDQSARIVEIAIIDARNGDVLYSSLVNPLCPIPAQSQHIHGISKNDVFDKPTFDVVWNQIKGILIDKKVVIYNFDFDYRMIEQSLSDFDYPVDNLKHFIRGDCAMLWYAEFYGEPSFDFYGPSDGYRWQKLTSACAQQSVNVSDLKAHRALADCEMTRRLLNTCKAVLEGFL
ncbi:DNA polymerase III subunit epsilon [Vibrio navarrensis]|uniref:3'-5' exonuclease n=1 Tax=Vibrio navarrensis TaxID=29495 RepID=UPI00186A6DF9|nr:3'-5' exonuclease [Vibrio navarrensis]MBE4592213.1 DNA polymerase III subunit epsilon [Vibrio navarrensis]